MTKIQNTNSWGSRVGLILAMAGNAVGLGNFLRFPMQAIQNGGGAFIIPYLVCFLLLGIPLLFVEWTIGRYGGQSGYHTAPFALHKLNNKPLWKYVGVFGIFSNLTIAAYYCYIESWSLSWVYHSVVGTFKGMSSVEVSNFFADYTDLTTTASGIPYEGIVFFALCLILNIFILSKGLKGGVEKAAKIMMPLLIIFGLFLAVKGITLKAGKSGALFDGTVGLNFLWKPQFESLLNPKVWLAAAGQVFFTLSLGLGTVQCFASYVKEKDDIALNALSAGWINEFVEIVLGSSIIIPIAIGYFGLDKVVELTSLGGFGLGFRVMPYLFQQWGPIFSVLAGLSFFGLLFFAGITSSLAMGTPITSFLIDEFNFTQKRASVVFGVIVFLLGLPTIFFFYQGVFDEYDYWAGTVSLVVFAMLEAILFSWIFGVNKGWKELNKGADVKIPIIYKYVLKYITPTILIIVFVSSTIRPVNDDWSKISIKGWELDEGSIIGQITHKNIKFNRKYFNDSFYSETDGIVDKIETVGNKTYISVTDSNSDSTRSYQVQKNCQIVVDKGTQVNAGDVLFKGKIVNNIFYQDVSRLLLTLTFISIAVLIRIAYKKRLKTGDI
ncbi:MAG: sodium-dependent transporter [Lentimicrobiaceae bacterium]|nr:sodium-dependent transporter [Lentimicrobiaceae bacterium]